MRAARKPKPSKVIESMPTSPEASPQVRVPSGEAAGLPWLKPRRFGVPTHVISVARDRRAYPRALLKLPLRLVRVAGQREPVPITLVTQNISSSGVFFLCPRRIEPGTPIELEVGLVERPFGRGSVRMTTAAHVVRQETTDTPGWHGVAAAFDDISFQRDEAIPTRFREA